MAMSTHDLLPVRARSPAKASNSTRDEQRHRRDLRRGGEEGGDRRRRALVDVGRPHVERHGRDLEGEAREQEDEAEDQPDGSGSRRAERRRRCSAKPVVPVKP